MILEMFTEDGHGNNVWPFLIIAVLLADYRKRIP